MILKQRELTVGTVYSHDSWENYWEGTLKRDNGNIGRLTTQTAEVLSYLFPSAAASFREQRDEAGISRLYAGIHYPSDISVGKDVGVRVADYTLRVARLDGADN